MAIAAPFNTPYFVGSPGSSSDVPGRYPVALAGHAYLLDEMSERFRHQSIPLLRQQSDQGSIPGENSVNPDDLWRRAQETWHFGAGQIFRDREETNPEVRNGRFRSSTGINVWEKYQLTLLNDVDQKKTSSNTNLKLMPAGSRLYLIDGSTLAYTTDVTVGSPTWTTVTGGSPGTFTSITSDGFTVYATDGVDVYSTDTSSGSKAVYNTLNANVVAYVKGRLMASGTGATKNSIYNITSGTPPAALYTHPNTDFTWVGFAAGRSAIYAAGFSGDKSLIYRIAIKPDASGLDQPILAGELPDGEIIRSIGGYLGFICLGTELGVRYAIPDGEGNLALGPAIETDSPPLCFEGQEKFIWFGWSNYDATSTGLGRLSLANFTEPLVPAYASDLMATGQGSVLSVATFQSIRVFTVSGSGVYAEDTANFVDSGTIDSGLIGYGIADQKTALFVDVRTTPLVGSYDVSVAADGGVFNLSGTETLSGDDGSEFAVGQLRGERYEVRLVLNRVAATATGPTITRWTLKVNPAAVLREFLFVPLLLHEKDRLMGGVEVPRDPQSELIFLKSLRAGQTVTTYQEGSLSYAVMLQDYEWVPHHDQKNQKAHNGTFVAKLKTVS